MLIDISKSSKTASHSESDFVVSELNRLEEANRDSSVGVDSRVLWKLIKRHFYPKVPDVNNIYKGCVCILNAQSEFLGSGTLLTDQTLVTAHHVVEEYLGDIHELRIVYDKVYLDQPDEFTAINGILLNGLEVHNSDFVVLNLSESLALNEFILPGICRLCDNLATGDVITVGYGNKTPFDWNESGIRRMAVGNIISEDRARELGTELQDKGYKPGWDILTYNPEYQMIASGDSGGPTYLVTNNGLKLIGIHRQIDNNSKVNFHTKFRTS